MTLPMRVVQCRLMSNTANTALDTSSSGEAETIGVRLPAHLIESLRAKRSAMAKATPGAAITMSDAVRALLLAGLAAES